MTDQEALTQSFLDRARALYREPDIFRATLLTSLICESIPFGIRAERDFFGAAYGDPSGRDYWNTHLSEPILVGAFAYLLSVHLPVNAEQLESARTAIILGLRDAVAAGERWFIGETIQLLTFDGSAGNVAAAADVKVRPRAAVDWLLSKPKREHLVPASLRDSVRYGPAASIKPMPLSRKTAEVFTVEFIDREKKAGRRPTLKSLEAAAKEANLHGGRDYLRDAFRRSPDVVVKPGRPSKIAEK